MYSVHIFCDGKMVSRPVLSHLPSCGDTVRLADEKYAKVTEVIWCMDEPCPAGQRINLRLESIEGETP